MRRTCHRIGFAALLALALLAVPSSLVLADQLGDAKKAGSVGERPDGYLGVVSRNAGAEVKALGRRHQRETAGEVRRDRQEERDQCQGGGGAGRRQAGQERLTGRVRDDELGEVDPETSAVRPRPAGSLGVGGRGSGSLEEIDHLDVEGRGRARVRAQLRSSLMRSS